MYFQNINLDNSIKSFWFQNRKLKSVKTPFFNSPVCCRNYHSYNFNYKQYALPRTPLTIDKWAIVKVAPFKNVIKMNLY